MSATLNLHKLLSGPSGYLADLRVAEPEKDALRLAREQIRATLRGAFRDWETHVKRTEMFADWITKTVDLALPTPKFRVQGSFAYSTVNDCQYNPPQQIDQDDGVFLPIGFLTSGGKTSPRIVSKAYFNLVERALAPLCAARGWHLNPGKLKSTCVRVEISPRLHIDLPLYAIRDDAFNRLVETALAKSMTFDARDGVELAQEVYRGLDAAEIMVAHRREGWLESDPRKLEDWFTHAILIYGEQVRRASRAFKGLRDARWSGSPLSSICIMAGVVQAYDRLGSLDQSRDDIAFMMLAREMADIFLQSIENPVFPGDATKHLCSGWSADERAAICDAFRRAAGELEQAIYGTLHRQTAINRTRNAFGARVPNDESLIPLVGAAEAIRQSAPEPQPMPMPPRTKSG